MLKKYETTRAVLKSLEVIGWIVVVIGFGAVGAALVAPQTNGVGSGGFGSASAGIVSVFGLGGAISGLMMVALTRVGDAIADIARLSVMTALADGVLDEAEAGTPAGEKPSA